jgi:hypothetical protein
MVFWPNWINSKPYCETMVEPINPEEWDELLSIRLEMNANLMAQDTKTQEKYTELLVKSLEGKGDGPVKVG